MKKTLLLAAALTPLLCGQNARAQTSTDTAVAPTVALQGNFGHPQSLDKGPWVLGEVLFFSAGRVAGDYTWRDKVRGTRGALYTKADILSDVDNLMAMGKFDKIEPALYEMAGTPVPQELAAVSASTSQVRLVFNVVEKPQAPGAESKIRRTPPAAVSGVVLTPTAYRGAGRYTTPGLGLDINGAYIIGRLYGRNSFENTPRKTNYIDRIGVWMLTADGKMQIQSESTIRPAVAVGGQGTFLFRDSPQPNVNDPNPSVSVNASQKSTKLLSAGYFVASKKFGPVRASAGVMQGSQGDAVAQFSEFLSPDALGFFAGQKGQISRSRTMPFASLLMLPKPEYPLAVEFIKFNGAALNPILINFKIGYFLHLNFDIGYLKFNGGYDLLGLIQFRYNHFPKR